MRQLCYKILIFTFVCDFVQVAIIQLKNLNRACADIYKTCMQTSTPKNRKSFQTLKSTLDMLENKINTAKEELQLPITSMGKKNQAYIHIDDKI